MHIRFDGYEIGCTHTSEVFLSDYEVPEHHLDIDDVPNLGRDGVTPGDDYLRGGQWLFDLTVHQQAGTRGVLEKTKPLVAAWRAWANRTDGPVPLQYSTDHGRTWFEVYGRPRQLTPPRPDADSLYRGRGKMVAAFFQTDPLHYSAEPVTTILKSTPSGGRDGWVFPLEWPIVSTQYSGTTDGVLRNPGDAPSPVTVEFHGWTQDRARVWSGNRAEVEIMPGLNWDEIVKVDGFTHETTMRYTTKNTVLNAPQVLAQNTMISELLAPPGQTRWSLNTVSNDGSAFAKLSIKPAFTTMRHDLGEN